MNVKAKLIIDEPFTPLIPDEFFKAVFRHGVSFLRSGNVVSVNYTDRTGAVKDMSSAGKAINMSMSLPKGRPWHELGGSVRI